MRQVTYSMPNKTAKPAAFVSTSRGAEYGPYQAIIIAVGGRLSNKKTGLSASVQDLEPRQMVQAREVAGVSAARTALPAVLRCPLYCACTARFLRFCLFSFLLQLLLTLFNFFFLRRFRDGVLQFLRNRQPRLLAHEQFDLVHQVRVFHEISL